MQRLGLLQNNNITFNSEICNTNYNIMYQSLYCDCLHGPATITQTFKHGRFSLLYPHQRLFQRVHDNIRLRCPMRVSDDKKKDSHIAKTISIISSMAWRGD